VHPRNDSAIRALHFDATGKRIPEAEFFKPAPVTITVGEMHRHFHAVAQWMRQTEAAEHNVTGA
jgi:hypothetical protein